MSYRYLALCLAALLATPAHATASCDAVVHELNQQIRPQINEAELTAALRSINQTGELPPQFLTKRQARDGGWRPGESLWQVPGLQGKSIGGDHFRNAQNLLPAGQWREADLDYQGARRGAKRLIFGRDGRRYITVDHYKQFMEIAPCQ